MPFPEKLLNEGEEVVLDLRPHWWAIVPASAALGAAIVIGVLTWVYTENDAARVLAGILVLAALGFFVVRYIRWVSENFVVTSQRVVYRSGVVAKRGIEIPLERINAVFFNQSLFERLIGAGDLAIESAAESGRQTFGEVRRPHQVQQEIYRQMEANEQRGYQRAATATAEAMRAAAVDATPVSIPDQIAQLDELRRRGAISDEEFETKKRDLLDRM